MSLYWQTIGNGQHDIVLLHGWGFNSRVWSIIIPQLKPCFRLHLVDLPGYGSNQRYKILSLEQIALELSLKAPAGAIWLGWSFGGLIAIMVAYMKLQEISGLITVSASPCFCSKNKKWPGIKKEALKRFIRSLHIDLIGTISRFIFLQTLGTDSARQDMRWLKNVVLTHEIPNIEVLISGLKLLEASDLRSLLKQIDVPIMHIYGYLDNIVPHTVVPLIKQYNSNSKSVILKYAAHVPFVSHSTSFCRAICRFVQKTMSLG